MRQSSRKTSDPKILANEIHFVHLLAGPQLFGYSSDLLQGIATTHNPHTTQKITDRKQVCVQGCEP